MAKGAKTVGALIKQLQDLNDDTLLLDQSMEYSVTVGVYDAKEHEFLSLGELNESFDVSLSELQELDKKISIWELCDCTQCKEGLLKLKNSRKEALKYLKRLEKLPKSVRMWVE